MNGGGGSSSVRARCVRFAPSAAAVDCLYSGGGGGGIGSAASMRRAKIASVNEADALFIDLSYEGRRGESAMSRSRQVGDVSNRVCFAFRHQTAPQRVYRANGACMRQTASRSSTCKRRLQADNFAVQNARKFCCRSSATPPSPMASVSAFFTRLIKRSINFVFDSSRRCPTMLVS